MYLALLAAEAPLTTDELREDLGEAGIDVVADSDAANLAQSAVRHGADLVVAASQTPSPAMFEAARLLNVLAPCPFVLFTADRDLEKMDRASASGIHAYVVDGYAKDRLRSVIEVARARFRHERLLKDELAGLARRFEERKTVDRAKGLLMRSRGIGEAEAFEMLRGLAMRSRQRIGVVAQSVTEMARAGEAVNRAGQLRMLSQRLVLGYAQALAGRDAKQAARLIDACSERVEANLVALHAAIDARGYAELVGRVEASWQPVRSICASPPALDRLDALDAASDAMLADAESLTGFLDASGLVPSLHIVNVAGRQRMLGQRIAKLCFLLAVEPTAGRLADLRERAATFEQALETLRGLPLTSESIRACLQDLLSDWRRCRRLLDALQDPLTLDAVADVSERLLVGCERLTDHYEQAMQILIGDRIGRLR